MCGTRATQRFGAARLARRNLLAHAAAAGAASIATLPAFAQDKPERRWSTLAAGELPLADTLARHALALKYEDLPGEIVRTVKRTILDTIGCAIGGYPAGPSQIAVKLAGEVSAKRPATLLCAGTKTSADLAAFANGVMIRYLDFNDGFVSLTRGAGHPSDTLAALLTAAELAGASGRDLIAATVVAYEVFTKVMDALDVATLGLDHSTITGLAAAAGAGRLMGLTPGQLTHAISITIGGNTVIRQGRVGTLSNWKAYAAADACRKALFALQLAQAGMTGPNQVFEGRDGFFNVISRGPFALPALGAPYGIARVFTKRFALGQFSQTVAQAAVEARAQVRDAAEIAAVNIGVSRAAIKVMADSPDKWRPQTHETADHSIPYSAGVALMYGRIGVEHYDDPYLHDAKLLELVSRVKVVPSDEADRNEKEFNLCDLELVLDSGERKRVRVEYHRGHPGNPMTDAEMEEKLRGLAGKQLAAARVDELIRLLWALDTLPQASAVIAATV